MARGSQASRPVRPREQPAARKERAARAGAAVQRLRASAPGRYLVAHPSVAAALLFGLLVLVYLWPALLRGELLSPISSLYGVTPWLRLAPKDIADYSNGLLTDVPTADYPWRFLIRQMLHEGTFPSWNPYVYGGIPLYSNPQTGLFSPFSLPLWILPLNYGIGVGAALKLWASGFGSYLLVRQLRLGFLPGLLAGVCFAFSAINIVWLTHETLPAVAALLPWMLWLVERIYQGGRLGSVVGLAAATAIGLGGGHPGMQVHLMVAVGFYALLRALFLSREEAPSLGDRLRPLGTAVGGLVLGALLMSFMLIPEALSTHGTIGTTARSHGQGTLPGTQMPLTVIRTVLFPDWWGRPSMFEGGNGPITELAPNVFVGVNYNERTLYAGAVGLLLALVGAAAGGRWRSKGSFLVLAVLGLAIPLHMPGLYQLVTHLPALELVQNQRLHFVWAMGMSVLAAFGLQALLERPAGERRRLAVVAGALVLGAVMVVVAGASGRTILRTAEHFVTGRDFRSFAVVSLTSVVWYLLFAVGVGVAFLAAWKWPERRVWIGAGLVLLAVADMLHFAGNYQPIAPASKSIPPKTAAIRFLERHRDDGRIVGMGVALANDWALTYGLRDIRGYDPPQPSARFFRLWKLAEPDQLDWTSFSLESLSPTGLQIASVLGARYVVAPEGVQLASGGGAPVRALSMVYDGRDARVFENARAAPRARVAERVRVVAGADARVTLADPSFDPRTEALVERGAEGTGAIAHALGADAAAQLAGSGSGASGSGRPGSALGASGRVTVGDPSPARVTMHAQLDRPGLVVLNDSWAPGWTVEVDGATAQPVRVNDVMRGVAVPAGTHEIEWSYRVPGLRAGLLLSLLAALGAVGGLVAVRRRNRIA